MTEKNAEEQQQAPDEELAPEMDAPKTTSSAGVANSDEEFTGAEAETQDDAVEEDESGFDRDGQGETPATPRRDRRIRERSPSRKTTLREERRHRSKARRARKRTIYGILGGIVATALITGLALPSFGSLFSPARDGDASGDIASVGTPVATQAGSILADGDSYTSYPSDPPTSGPSYALGIEWGIYAEQQANEAVVRNLEQGGIVVSHNLRDDAQIADLTSYLETQPGYPGCYVMQPYSSVTEGSVTLTSWGWIDTYIGVDRPSMQQFVADHRNDAPQFVSQTCGADTTIAASEFVDYSGN